MFWELYTQEYLFDEDGYICGESLHYNVTRFNNYKDAFAQFTDIVIHNEHRIARVWIKVYQGEHDPGEIMTAHSLIWGDSLFNEDAVC